MSSESNSQNKTYSYGDNSSSSSESSFSQAHPMERDQDFGSPVLAPLMNSFIITLYTSDIYEGKIFLDHHLYPKHFKLPITVDWYSINPFCFFDYFGQETFPQLSFPFLFYKSLFTMVTRLQNSEKLDKVAGPLCFLQLWIILHFPEFIPLSHKNFSSSSSNLVSLD